MDEQVRQIVAARLEREKGEIAHELAVLAGSSLEEARQRVEAYLDREMATTGPGDATARGSHDELLQRELERQRLSGGPVSLLSLIKALRDQTGLGLRESKLTTEDFLRREAPDVLASSRVGCLGALFALLTP